MANERVFRGIILAEQLSVGERETNETITANFEVYTPFTGAAIRIVSDSSATTTINFNDGSDVGQLAYNHSIDQFSLNQDTAFLSTGALTLPVGDTASRPANGIGKIRYNSDTDSLEFYRSLSASWEDLVIASGDIVTGSLQLSSNDPILSLNEEDGTVNARQSAVVESGGFAIQSLDDVDAVISTDYMITRNTSGATDHEWRVADTARLALDASLLTVSTTTGQTILVSGGDSTLTITSQGGADNSILVLDTDNSFGESRINFTGPSVDGSIVYDHTTSDLIFNINAVEVTRILDTGLTVTGIATVTQDDASASAAAFNSTNPAYVGSIVTIDAVSSPSAMFDALVVTTDNGLDTIFRVQGDGEVYADGQFNTTGADYAEYFESATGEKFPVGSTVVFDGDKIRLLRTNEDKALIRGVIRPKDGGPAMVGNSATIWPGKYLKDDYGSPLRNEYGVLVLNPKFDPARDYKSRYDREEWMVVGLIGRVPITNGQPTNPRWIKLRDISATVEEWLIGT